ncbi:NUDIX domain-containing protein [Lacticaseibacillus baoqingensis]|uniref:NUDIX domain-containing protein n=1 Tax=Lacticaseibacillus baoqingensis TaxID=2486013 RepID=A0ABW4E8A7_9LACO|nr:NUDIX domain-containing protein [Lacticaseibacillus baoqingensis]
MVKAYTIVLVQTPVGYLLINRAKPPYQGLWNGLGGKVEPNETPSAGAIREVAEECGLVLPAVTACGLVHWLVDDRLQGELYLFSGVSTSMPSLPQATREGVLAAFDRQWLTASQNQGLVPDLAAMLPLFWAGQAGEYLSHFAGERFLGLEQVAND